MSAATRNVAERADDALRELFAGWGYERYQVNRFEEYDLYARNRNFLVSDRVLAFTDTDGRLLALKPDVTLSVVRNTPPRPGALRKLFYSEHVYRAEDEETGFREIMQTGLECIGAVDRPAEAEVVMLACRSLEVLSGGDYILSLSHAGILPAILAGTPLKGNADGTLHRLLGEKNVPEILSYCAVAGCPETGERLRRLAELYGAPAETLPALEALAPGAAEELREVCGLLSLYGVGDRVRLDFSLVNDMNYYSGLIFRGHLRSVSRGVLSGGRYDGLAEKLGKTAGAVGFAVYLDRLPRGDGPCPALDTALLYDEKTDPALLIGRAAELRREGRTVRCCRTAAEAAAAVTEDLRGRKQ